MDCLITIRGSYKRHNAPQLKTIPLYNDVPCWCNGGIGVFMDCLIILGVHKAS